MKGYRTIIVNVLTVATAIIALPEVTGLIPADGIPYLLAVQGAINIAMRFVTSTPIGVAVTPKPE